MVQSLGLGVEALRFRENQGDSFRREANPIDIVCSRGAANINTPVVSIDRAAAILMHADASDASKHAPQLVTSESTISCT